MRNTSKPRSDQIGIRLAPDERQLVEAAARKDQRNISDWARLALLRAARRLLRKAA